MRNMNNGIIIKGTGNVVVNMKFIQSASSNIEDLCM